MSSSLHQNAFPSLIYFCDFWESVFCAVFEGLTGLISMRSSGWWVNPSSAVSTVIGLGFVLQHQHSHSLILPSLSLTLFLSSVLGGLPPSSSCLGLEPVAMVTSGRVNAAGDWNCIIFYFPLLLLPFFYFSLFSCNGGRGLNCWWAMMNLCSH